MREIFSLGKLKGINLTRFSPQFSPHFSPHMSGARFTTASTIWTFFLEILKKISPVRSAELPKVVVGFYDQMLYFNAEDEDSSDNNGDDEDKPAEVSPQRSLAEAKRSHAFKFHPSLFRNSEQHK